MKREKQLEIHKRWIKQLQANPPSGVPAEENWGGMWPATFGDLVEGRPVHRVDDGEGYCFQCLHCKFYKPLEGDLGADWGACFNKESQYDRQVVFEHWTCTEYVDEGAR